MSESRQGASAGPWKIEEGTAVNGDGFRPIVTIEHDSNPALICVLDEDLPLLLGALMTFLGVERIEAQ